MARSLPAKAILSARAWVFGNSRAILLWNQSDSSESEWGEGIMAEGTEASRWRRTRVVAAMALAIGSLVSVIVVLLAPMLNAGSVLGIPSGLFGASLAAPGVVLLIIFWAAERQRRIDRAHGFF
jgi:putative solute:sodium symporter small subunit